MDSDPDGLVLLEVTAPQLNRCFVVGPIGNKFAAIATPAREVYEEALDVFEKVIVPACQAFSIDPIRSDQIAVSGAVTQQVLRHIYEDEIVIADVSGGNPNVMYELGLRHTRDLLTIQIGEYGQLPFDIADIRTIQFSRSDRGLIDARKQLERAIQIGLSELPDQTAATRIWNAGGDLNAALGDLETSRAVSDDPAASKAENLDENGLVERLAAMEDAFPVITEIAGAIGVVLNDLGAVAVSSSAEIETTNESSPSAKARLTVIAKFANALQAPAEELALQTQRFHDHMADMDAELIGLLDFIEKHPETGDVNSFLTSITDMAKSTREAMESIGGFGAIVENLSDLSKTLRRPTRQIGDAVKVMMSSVKFTDEWDTRARKLQRARAAA